jgi:hypothetical protein
VLSSSTRVPPVRFLVLGVLLVTVLGGGTCGSVFAQARSAPDSVRRAALEDFHGPDLKGKDGPLAKAGLDLLLLYHEHRARTDGARALSSADEPGETARGAPQVQDGRVVIDATAAGDVAALAADLDSLGMTDVATAGGLVSGRFPISNIPALARLPTLRGVVPSRMRTRSGTGSDAAPARSLRPEDVDRPPAAEPPPEAGDTADATPAPPSGPDPTATASPAAPSPRSSDEAPSPATSPAADVSSPLLDDAGEASAVLWLLIVLMATVLLLEER